MLKGTEPKSKQELKRIITKVERDDQGQHAVQEPDHLHTCHAAGSYRLDVYGRQLTNENLKNMSLALVLCYESILNCKTEN